MRILYLCGNYGLNLEKMLGPKIHILSILSGLEKAGHQPILVAVQKEKELPSYLMFEVHVLIHQYMRGFIHRIIPYTGLIDSLNVFFTIRKIHKQTPIDIIHERYTGLSWGGVLAAKIFKIPFVLEMNGPGIEEKTIQGNPIKPSKKRLLLINQKVLLSYNDRLILASQLISNFIYDRRGWKLPKYYVLLNGAELPEPITQDEKSAIRRQYNAEDHPLFLYSGSLYRWYGSLNIVKAFQIALTRFPDLKLAIIGSGDAEDEMRNFIRNHHLESSIYMKGTMAHSDLQKVIQSMDICLVYYPGDPTYFGTSTKITEYMAAGKPVISTPHMFEIIDDGITGFLSKSSAPEDFAGKLIEVLKNTNFALTVGENAHIKIENRYLWKHYIHNLLNIYKSIFI